MLKMCNINIHYLYLYLTILLCFGAGQSNKLDAFWTPNNDCVDTSQDPCSLLEDICKPHGQCVPQGCNYKCVCQGGFEGAECQNPPSQTSAVEPGPEPSSASNGKRLDIIVGNGALNFLDSLLKESTTSSKALITSGSTTTPLVTITTSQAVPLEITSEKFQLQEPSAQIQTLQTSEVLTSISKELPTSKKAISSTLDNTTEPAVNESDSEINVITSIHMPLATSTSSLSNTQLIISPINTLAESSTKTITETESTTSKSSLQAKPQEVVTVAPVEKHITQVTRLPKALSTLNQINGSVTSDSSKLSSPLISTDPTILRTASKSPQNEPISTQTDKVKEVHSTNTSLSRNTDLTSEKPFKKEIADALRTSKSTRIPVTVRPKQFDSTTMTVKFEAPAAAPPTQTVLSQESTLSLLSSLVSELKTLTENLPKTLGLRPATLAVEDITTTINPTVLTTVRNLDSQKQDGSTASTATENIPTETSKQSRNVETVTSPTTSTTTEIHNEMNTLISKVTKDVVVTEVIENTLPISTSGTDSVSATISPLAHLPVLSAILDPDFMSKLNRKMSQPQNRTSPTNEPNTNPAQLVPESALQKTQVSTMAQEPETTTETLVKTTTNDHHSIDESVLISAAASKDSKNHKSTNHLLTADKKETYKRVTLSKLPGDSLYLSISPSTTTVSNIQVTLPSSFDAEFYQSDKSHSLLLTKGSQMTKDPTVPDSKPTHVHPWKSGQLAATMDADNNNVVPNTIRGHMTRKDKITKDIQADTLHGLPSAPEIHKFKTSTTRFFQEDTTDSPELTTLVVDSNEEAGDDKPDPGLTSPDSKTVDQDDNTTRREPDYETFPEAIFTTSPP